MTEREPAHAAFAVGTARLEADLGALLRIDPGFVGRMPPVRRRLRALAARVSADPLALVLGATVLVLAMLAIVVMHPSQLPSRRIADPPVAALPPMRGQSPAPTKARHKRASRTPPHRTEPIRPLRKDLRTDRATSVGPAQTLPLPDPIAPAVPPAAAPPPTAAERPNPPNSVVHGGEVHPSEVAKTPEPDARRERREAIDAIRALRQR